MRSLHSQMELCRRVQVILGVALGVGVLVFYLGAYRPMLGSLESLQLQIESKQRELSTNQNKAANVELLAREVGKLQSLAAAYDRQFPRQVELGEFIRDVTRISQQLSLQELKYEPLSPRRGESYFALPIAMHFQGDFLNVARFLRQIEDMQRLTRVKRVEIKNRDNKSGVVQVEMAMSIYFSEG